MSSIRSLKLMLLLFIPFTLSAQNKTYQLYGSIKDYRQGQKVYLKIYGTKDHDSFDSTAVSNGKFIFKGICKEPEMALLYLNHTADNLQIKKGVDYFPLYIDQGRFNVYIKDSVKNAVISGSKINADWKIYKEYIAKPMAAYEQINARYRDATPKKKSDTAYKAFVTKRSMEIALDIKARQKQYLINYPASAYRLYALMDYAGRVIDVADVAPIFNSLPLKDRQTTSAKELAQALKNADNISSGALAPLFTQNNTNNVPVSLKSYRGKYVLLDFWASWCLPCRVELPNVVKLFNQYKDKNFTVLSISLDNQAQKKDWLNAVKLLNMQWENLSDLNGRNNSVAKLYKVSTIPQNFLIDPKGVIIAKDLIGKDLEDKLKSLFP